MPHASVMSRMNAGRAMIGVALPGWRIRPDVMSCSPPITPFRDDSQTAEPPETKAAIAWFALASAKTAASLATTWELPLAARQGGV